MDHAEVLAGLRKRLTEDACIATPQELVEAMDLKAAEGVKARMTKNVNSR